MPDLYDEPAPLLVNGIPRERATQLRRTQCVSRPAGIFLGANVRYSSTVTCDERPHGDGLRPLRRGGLSPALAFF